MIETVLLAAVISTTPTCSWDSPGSNRYIGNTSAAVHNYVDIPISIRKKLEYRINRHDYDDNVVITADNISGKSKYSNLRDMHFGKNQICHNITRSKWKDTASESGLVYCESGHCIIVPAVCGNVSRVTQIQETPTESAGGVAGGGIPYLYRPIEHPAVVSFQELARPNIIEQDTKNNQIPVSYVPIYGGDIIPCRFKNHMCQFVIPPRPPIPPIPEPKTYILFILGLMFIMYRRWASCR